MNKPLRIALLQLISHQSDQNANLEKGEHFCRKAKASGADIALFPEMWNIGYCLAHNVSNNTAVSLESSFVQHYRNLAKELNMAIAITYLEKYNEKPRNSLSLIDRHGAVQFTYAKVHTCDFSDESGLTPGEDFFVSDLDTEQGLIKIGAMICFDREFPESARILMLKGAEIILTPNACEMEANRIAQFKTRAYENMLGVALANYAAPQHNGHSCAFDGMAFNDDESSRNTEIVMADEREGLIIANFDIEKIRAWRKREVWGNAFRKPRHYGLIKSEVVTNPFIRGDLNESR